MSGAGPDSGSGTRLLHCQDPDYHLVGLDGEETRQYIDHRVRHAGGTPGLFEQAACQAVYNITRGIPRIINRVCDLSLVYGYSEESPRISAEIVNRVIEDQHMGNLLDDVLPAATYTPPAERAAPGTDQ